MSSAESDWPSGICHADVTNAPSVSLPGMWPNTTFLFYVCFSCLPENFPRHLHLWASSSSLHPLARIHILCSSSLRALPCVPRHISPRTSPCVSYRFWNSRLWEALTENRKEKKRKIRASVSLFLVSIVSTIPCCYWAPGFPTFPVG